MKRKTVIIILAVLLILSIVSSVILRYAPTSRVDSISQIDDKTISQLDSIFKKENAKLTFYPLDRKITLSQGSTKKGFAFAIKNKNLEEETFVTKIYVDPMFEISRHCGSLKFAEAESWLLQKVYNSRISGSSVEEYPNLVLFTIPENAPMCTIPYIVESSYKDVPYFRGTVYVKIENKQSILEKTNNFLHQISFNLGTIYARISVFDLIPILIIIVIIIVIFYPKNKEN